MGLLNAFCLGRLFQPLFSLGMNMVLNDPILYGQFYSLIHNTDSIPSLGAMSHMKEC